MGKERRPSQEAKVLKFFENHAFLTCDLARTELGIGHLPRRIGNLREAGYLIETEMKYYVKADGSPGKYARYWFHGGGPENG